MARSSSDSSIGTVLGFVVGTGAVILLARMFGPREAGASTIPRMPSEPLPRGGGSSDEPAVWGSGWTFPVPDYVAEDGTRYHAEVSQGFHDKHRGVDIMYRRRSPTDRGDFPPGVVDSGGAKQHRRYFSPPGTPILAARGGKVWSTTFLPDFGWYVVLDHGAPWATSYHHLASLAIPEHKQGKRVDGSTATTVRAGDKLGTMGHAPSDGELLRHLHFEAWWKGGDSRAARDPTEVMQSWRRTSWNG